MDTGAHYLLSYGQKSARLDAVMLMKPWDYAVDDAARLSVNLRELYSMIIYIDNSSFTRSQPLQSENETTLFNVARREASHAFRAVKSYARRHLHPFPPSIFLFLMDEKGLPRPVQRSTPFVGTVQ